MAMLAIFDAHHKMGKAVVKNSSRTQREISSDTTWWSVHRDTSAQKELWA